MLLADELNPDAVFSEMITAIIIFFLYVALALLSLDDEDASVQGVRRFTNHSMIITRSDRRIWRKENVV